MRVPTWIAKAAEGLAGKAPPPPPASTDATLTQEPAAGKGAAESFKEGLDAVVEGGKAAYTGAAETTAAIGSVLSSDPKTMAARLLKLAGAATARKAGDALASTAAAVSPAQIKKLIDALQAEYRTLTAGQMQLDDDGLPVLEECATWPQNPQDAEIFCRIAGECFKAGDAAKALRYARLAHHLDPKSPRVAVNFGVILAATGMKDAAADRFAAYFAAENPAEALGTLKILAADKAIAPVILDPEFLAALIGRLRFCNALTPNLETALTWAAESFTWETRAPSASLETLEKILAFSAEQVDADLRVAVCYAAAKRAAQKLEAAKSLEYLKTAFMQATEKDSKKLLADFKKEPAFAGVRNDWLPQLEALTKTRSKT